MHPTQKNFDLFYFKSGCLLFWAVWFAIASLTNLFDFIQALGGLSADWLFRSGNYLLMENALDIYHLASLLLNLLFTCNIIIQLASAILFFIALKAYFRRIPHAFRFINTAFILSIALWAAFLIIEELFIAYQYESVHISLFTLEIITLMAIHLLPEPESLKRSK